MVSNCKKGSFFETFYIINKFILNRDQKKTKYMYNNDMNNNESKDILKTCSILYVEDEDEIRINLTNTLNLIFDNVIAVSNAEDAIKSYNLKLPDIILSDISLPNMSGIDFVKLIREKDSTTPIILLTAHMETSILINAIKLKLVDYLTKPASFDELYTAFINSIKEMPSKNNIINFTTNIQYNTILEKLYKNDKEEHLTKKEKLLLNSFINNKGKTLSIEVIKDLIWEDSYYVSDAAFKSLLNKLRVKIGKDTIQNISGVGYHLVTI